MLSLAQRILEHEVRGVATVFFMGQAGFIIKDREGILYAADVYFTDCCEREFGFRRLIPKLLAPDEIVFDFVLTTHDHYDHYDIDAMPVLMSNMQTILVTTPTGCEITKQIGVSAERVQTVRVGEEIRVGNLAVKAMPCDHGSLAPDAVGFLFEIDGKRIWLVGDSAYHENLCESVGSIDLLFVPINGAFGNMNEHEAARFSRLCSPTCVVPCHYGNFAEHGGDVSLFLEDMKGFDGRVLPLCIGDTIEL